MAKRVVRSLEERLRESEQKTRVLKLQKDIRQKQREAKIAKAEMRGK